MSDQTFRDVLLDGHINWMNIPCSEREAIFDVHLARYEAMEKAIRDGMHRSFSGEGRFCQECETWDRHVDFCIIGKLEAALATPTEPTLSTETTK